MASQTHTPRGKKRRIYDLHAGGLRQLSKIAPAEYFQVERDSTKCKQMTRHTLILMRRQRNFVIAGTRRRLAPLLPTSATVGHCGRCHVPKDRAGRSGVLPASIHSHHMNCPFAATGHSSTLLRHQQSFIQGFDLPTLSVHKTDICFSSQRVASRETPNPTCGDRIF